MAPGAAASVPAAAGAAREGVGEGDVALGEQGAHQREAVGVQAVRGDAQQGVAGGDVGRAPQRGAAGDADGEAGEVEGVVVAKVAGVFGGLAAQQRAAGAQAAFVDAAHDVGHGLRVDLAHHQVVEKEQRRRAAGRDVVDAHGHGVDADGAVDAHLAGEHDLGAGAVGAGHEHGVVDRRHAQQPGEAADALEHERVVHRAQALFEQPHGFVAGGHVDARLLVGEVPVGDHDPPWCSSSTRSPGRQDPSPGRYSTADAARPSSGARRCRGLRLWRRPCDSWTMAPAPDTLTIDDLLFAVRWSHRRRTIGIGIPSQGPPTLAAPAGCRRATIEAAVRSKLPWVRRKLAERDARPQMAPPERRYETGESFPYLGGHYELVVVDDGPPAARADAGHGADRAADATRSANADQGASPGRSSNAGVQLEFDEPRGAGRKRPARARPRLRLRNGRFELARAAQAEGRAVFLAWYRRRATEVLKERIAYYAPLVGVAAPPITIKDMHSRWGSCSAKGRVNLYWGLVALPLELADYVVVHELAHLLELNHSPAFWRGVERVLPDYRERRKRLRSEGPRSVI